MRIALTCNFSPWSSYCGGAQRSTHALASALVTRGHDVHVVYTEGPWRRPSRADQAPYRAHFAPFVALKPRRAAPLRPLNALPVLWALGGIDRATPLDIVHAQGEEGALVDRLAGRRRLGFVVTSRFPSFPPTLHPDSPVRARARLWTRDPKYPLLGRAIAHADRVCTTSHAAASNLRRAFGADAARTVVIPNGVDERFFAGRWRGPRDDAPLLFFGRVEPEKGVDVLLRAMTSCPRRAIIVGRGQARDRYVELARELGLGSRIEFVDWQSPDRLVALLSECAMAVLPSREESFGNAMVEAMAAGVPLVTTRAGSIPEVVGDAAEMVAAGEATALAEAISRVVGDRARATKLAEAGRRHVLHHFTWSAVAARYEALYGELA